MSIEYNYPIEELDKIIQQIDQGITPMMTPDLKAEVALRYQELQHEGYDDEDDEEYMTAIQKHEAAMKAIEDNRRKSHSRNVVILDLTEAEQAEIHDACSCCYVRSDPNSEYNISDEDLASSEDEARLRRRLSTISKIYYHQEDYRNAMGIISEAIEYSLRHDYPWLTYEEALQAVRDGRIKYTFGPIPLLYIGYDTPISDPQILKGICDGSINLVDKDSEPVKKKKKERPKPVDMPYTVITPAEHAEYAKIHNAGYNTPISTILKSCSTIYNRYVMPTTIGWDKPVSEETPTVDWLRPGAGEEYYRQKYHVETNPVTEITGLINAANNHKMNHVIGNGIRDFINGLSPKPETYKGISTSLHVDQKVVDLESRLMDIIRATNPDL